MNLAEGGAFVGRVSDLAALETGLAATMAGRGRSFSLEGESGIGKTRLARRFCAIAAQRGARPCWGRAWEGGGAPALWPWIEILRSLGAEERTPGQTGLGGVLSAMLSPPHPATPAEPAGQEDADRSFELFDAVSSSLRGLAQEEPLVLVLDDLHAADHASCLLAVFLARELRGSRILLLSTWREEEARTDRQRIQALRQLEREGVCLRLGPLDPEGISELGRAMLGRPLPMERVVEIARMTEGNPLYVEEILRALPEEGPLTVPPRLRNTILRRLEPLAPECRKLLAEAAVLGLHFTAAFLGEVVGLAPAAILPVLDEAVRGDVLHEEGPGAFRFGHGLLRAVAYDGLAPARRSELHLAAAEALERTGADERLSELAHHFAEALRGGGDPERAVAYAVRAADFAERRSAWKESERLHERALDALEVFPAEDPERRCDLLLALGRTRSRAGRPHNARESFREAATLARRIDSAERLARAALGVATCADATTRENPEAATLLEEGLTRLGAVETPLRVRTLAGLSRSLYFTKRRDQMEVLSAGALDLARRLGDGPTLAFALGARHFALCGPGRTRERLGLATEMVERARAAGVREIEIDARFWRFADLLELGETPAAALDLAAYAALGEELRQPFYRWRTVTLRAMLALLEGRFDEGERLSEEALAAEVGLRSPDPRFVYGVQIHWLRREQGHGEEIEEEIRSRADAHSGTPAFRAGLAHLLADLGRLDEARKELERLAARDFADLPTDSNWMNVIAEVAQVATRLGDRRRAERLYHLLLPHADLNVLVGFAEICGGSVSRYLGLLATTLERWSDAERHFEDALAMNLRLGARPFVAHTENEYADMLLSRGDRRDRERARRLRESALAAATALGMGGLVRKLEATAPTARRSADAAAKVEEFVFRHEGDTWLIAFAAAPFRLRDRRGLGCIARLLERPGTPFHALELDAATRPAVLVRVPDPAQIVDAGLRVFRREVGSLAPDGAALARYRSRLGELPGELDKAAARNDTGRAVVLREEFEAIAHELERAKGADAASTAAGRARVNLTKAIHGAIAVISEASPRLAEHLGRSIRTGWFFSYSPIRPIDWRF